MNNPPVTEPQNTPPADQAIARRAPAASPAVTAPGATSAAPARGAPARPPISSSNTAPVLVKLTPPFSVRMSQLLWILSFAIGAFTVVYYFIIRAEQLPLIADHVRGVAEGRSDETYDTVADIMFWVVFGLMIAVLLTQVTLLVSFSSRRPNTRWWQLATFGLQVILVLLSMEWVALGDRGNSLLILLAAQAGLVLLALLSSTLPKAIAWSARQYDVRHGPQGVMGGHDI